MKTVRISTRFSVQLVAILLLVLITAFAKEELSQKNPFLNYGGDLRITLFGYEYVSSLKKEGKIGAFHYDREFSFKQTVELNTQIVEFVENSGGGYKSRASIIFVTKHNIFALPYANVEYLNGEFMPVDEIVSGDIIIFTSDH